MKKFRVNNLTVAIDSQEEALACGQNFSCPGGALSACPGNTFICGPGTQIGCGFTPCPAFSHIGCQVFTPICRGFTPCPGFSGICQGISRCPGFSDICPAVTVGGCGVNFSTAQPGNATDIIRNVDPIDRVELIASMKADLKVALEELDVAEKEAVELNQPQTLDDVNELEGSLKAALDEVQVMKAKLGQ